MMRSHAIANGVFVAAPNRVGREGELQFWGGSFVSDPNGNLLAKGQHDERRNRCWPSATSAWSTSSAPTGPSCATGGSMRTVI